MSLNFNPGRFSYNFVTSNSPPKTVLIYARISLVPKKQKEQQKEFQSVWSSCNDDKEWEREKKFKEQQNLCFPQEKGKGKPDQQKENERKRENKRFQWFNIISMNKKLFYILVRSRLDDVRILWVYLLFVYMRMDVGSLFYANIFFCDLFTSATYVYTCCIRASQWHTRNNRNNKWRKNGKTNYLNLFIESAQNGIVLLTEDFIVCTTF